MVFRTLSCSLLLTFPATDGYKVDVSSSGLIDHLKCSPLLQHSNVLHWAWQLFLINIQFKPPPTSPQGCLESEQWNKAFVTICGLFSPEIRSIFLLHPSLFLMMNSQLLFRPLFLTFQVTVLFPLISVFDSLFQACFTFTLILLSVHPSVSFLSHSPSPSHILLLLLTVAVHIAVCCKQKKKIDWASTQWPEEWTWAQPERQKERTDEKKRVRQKQRETGRKAQHQQGFSFVKQEVWGTKGQTEGLFQSVPLLSHCFLCHSSRRAAYRVVFVTRNRTVPENVSGVSAFVFGINAAIKTESKGAWQLWGMNEFGI